MPHLSVQGRLYEWPDPSTITYREARMVKQHLDASVMNIINDLQRGYASEETLLAMFLIAKVRQDKAFDFDKVMDLKLDDIDFIPDPEPEPDPSDPPAPATEETEPVAADAVADAPTPS